MFLGRVIGTVWATEKDPALEGMKMLIVREVNVKLEPQSKYVIAIDTVQAGMGEIVMIAQGSSARQTEATRNTPVDAVVMAVVDNLALRDPAELQAEYEERREPIRASIDNQSEI